MNLDISLILVPIQKQENQIRKTVDLLAEKYHSYPFVPHITVYHFGTTSLLNELIQFIDTSLDSIHPFDLELDNICYSDKFTKTLYANYKINTPLTHLYTIFHDKYKNIHNYHLAPHLSLIYKNNMKNEDKEKEIAALSVPKYLTIDKLSIITKENGSIVKEEDILQWNTAHQVSFA